MLPLNYSIRNLIFETIGSIMIIRPILLILLPLCWLIKVRINQDSPETY